MSDTPETPTGDEAEQRSAMVALVGRTNVGKSTLINALLGEKISIVSRVVQTTRNLVRGMLTEPRGQLVFLDTPGMHKASHDLGHVMNRVARASIQGCDVVLLVVDISHRPRLEDDGWIRRLVMEDVPVVVALNKNDGPTDESEAYRELWDAIRVEKERETTAHWLSISALTGAGVPELIDHLFSLAPPGPHLFPDDVLTDFPRRLAFADVVREKLFASLRQELPHAVAVHIGEIQEDGDAWHAEGEIYVDRPSQKGIVIGKKGRQLKKAIHDAERDLSEMYDRKITLRVWVEVQKNWAKNPALLQKLGYLP